MSVNASPEPTETGILTVDLNALVANWRLLDVMAPGTQCAAVVKADGYGLGLGPTMRALSDVGCRVFFVANVSEGERARLISPDATIYVLDGLAPGAGQKLIASRLRPVLCSLAEIEDWGALSRTVGRRLEAAVHIDTGMNRMGLAPFEAAVAARRTSDIALRLVMSHFISSQWPEDPHNGAQISAFEAAHECFPGVPASLANSAGIFLPHKPHYDLVRPGYALFGGNPTPGRPNPMQPVAHLEARILAVRDIAEGETVGYDATWTAPRPTRLATIGLGYADGVPVGASASADKPAAYAMLEGARCPFVGRVSMDFIVLDVTEAPHGAARRGAKVEILGKSIGIDDLAARSGTIGYEILTRLGARYARRYVGG